MAFFTRITPNVCFTDVVMVIFNQSSSFTIMSSKIPFKSIVLAIYI